MTVCDCAALEKVILALIDVTRLFSTNNNGNGKETCTLVQK